MNQSEGRPRGRGIGGVGRVGAGIYEDASRLQRTLGKREGRRRKGVMEKEEEE